MSTKVIAPLLVVALIAGSVSLALEVHRLVNSATVDYILINPIWGTFLGIVSLIACALGLLDIKSRLVRISHPRLLVELILYAFIATAIAAGIVFVRGLMSPSGLTVLLLWSLAIPISSLGALWHFIKERRDDAEFYEAIVFAADDLSRAEREEFINHATRLAAAYRAMEDPEIRTGLRNIGLGMIACAARMPKEERKRLLDAVGGFMEEALRSPLRGRRSETFKSGSDSPVSPKPSPYHFGIRRGIDW